MFLYRAVIRGGLNEGEVRPYQAANLGYPRGRSEENSEAVSGETEAIDPLELRELGPLFFLLAAQEKAEEILAQARTQAEELRKEGFEQGMAQGREEGKKDLLPSLVALADAGQALIVFEQQLISRYTPQLVRLALEIAEKVIGKPVEEDPRIVASILERARGEVSEAKLIRIWLHPADYRTLEETRPDLVRVGEDGGRKIEVRPSEEIGRGGCRVETEIGLVDATLPTQIQELRRQLLDEETIKATNGHSAPEIKKD